MRIYLKNNPADEIETTEPQDFLRVSPNKNKNNQMSSDTGSVPGLKWCLMLVS